MEFSIKQGSPEKLRSGCVVVGIFEGGKLSDAAQALDKSAQHYISDIIARGDMTGKAASTLLLHNVPNIASERVLLLGLGKRTELDSREYQNCARAAMRALQATNTKDALLYLAETPVKGRDSAWCIKQTVHAAYEASYRFDRLKSKAEADKKILRKIQFGLLNEKPSATLEAALVQASATAQGMVLAKDLGNLPGNYCTPTYLAQQAVSLSKTHKSIKTTILEEKDMKKLGMGSLLSVTLGSSEPAKLITMEYHGADKKHKPIVLVGKGVTFDSGGISLKPGAEMDEMKYDMCGAASVLGTIQAIAEMGLKLNVVGIIPACENMPSGNAIKPGDIVTSKAPPGTNGCVICVNIPQTTDAFLPRKLLMQDMAVTTSGDAFQYFEHNGKKYSHIIDPRTGYGLLSRRNVTIIAPDGTTADWLATACSILPIKAAKKLAEKNGASLLITELTNGKLRYHTTPGFAQYWKP